MTRLEPGVAAEELVVLVDETDAPLGVAGKTDAHREGRLHRAVSVVLFDRHGRVLLQRRAAAKYHSPGLWSNTCCGHPRPGEAVVDAARRRLRDELAIDGCALMSVSRFLYFAELGGGLAEHELDHVVIGLWDGRAVPNPDEVSETRWVEGAALLSELDAWPERFTAWAREVVVRAVRHERELEGSGGSSAGPSLPPRPS